MVYGKDLGFDLHTGPPEIFGKNISIQYRTAGKGTLHPVCWRNGFEIHPLDRWTNDIGKSQETWYMRFLICELGEEIPMIGISKCLIPETIFSLGFVFTMAACSAGKARPEKPHHTDWGFRNPGVPVHAGVRDFLKWRWERKWKDIADDGRVYFHPVENNKSDFLRSNREATTLTWIGHSTVLLQMNGMNILTDPIFSNRTSPVGWAGPRRIAAPGIPMDELPPIDVVIISHDHYDHLDRPTVAKLIERENGNKTIFLVPLGLRQWFERMGTANVFELDWWESHLAGENRFTAVPVQHWSKRNLFARNRTLWAGWAVNSPGFSFFHAADSGYTKLFKEIGKKLGPFDLSAIPIGSYEPRWLMRPHHMNPEEAVRTHMDVRSKKSVAIHWGTFILTDEPPNEPPERLENEKRKMRIPDGDFSVLKHGETIFP